MAQRLAGRRDMDLGRVEKNDLSIRRVLAGEPTETGSDLDQSRAVRWQEGSQRDPVAGVFV